MQYIASIGNIRWHINWMSALFFICFFILFLSLGIWQINRAEEKQQWLDNQQSQLNDSAKPHSMAALASLSEFTKVRLEGRFDAGQFWHLQNQVLNGVTGFDILVPFTNANQQSVLINLGWSEEPLTTLDHLPLGPITIEAIVRAPLDLPFVENIFTELESSVVEILPEYFPYPDLINSNYLQIEPDQPYALVTHWQHTVMKPAKHIGYAIQWFAMAVVLLIAFFLANSNLAQLLGWQSERN